jgi:hypothetical protein
MNDYDCPKFESCSAAICPLFKPVLEQYMLPSERTCSILLEYQKPFSEEFLRECYGEELVALMAKATALIHSDGTYPIRHALSNAAKTGSRLRHITNINQIEKESC